MTCLSNNLMTTWKSHKCIFHSLQWYGLRRKQKGCIYKCTRAAIWRCLSLHIMEAHLLIVFETQLGLQIAYLLGWQITVCLHTWLGLCTCQSPVFLLLSMRTSTLLDKAPIIITTFYHNCLLLSKLCLMAEYYSIL